MRNKTGLIRERILKNIGDGVWGTGKAIPPVRELETLLAGNKQTIQKAIRELADAGVIESRPRLGNFVLDRALASELLTAGDGVQIAFLLPRWIQNGPGNPSFAEMLDGAEEAAAASGVSLIYKGLPWKHDEREFSLRSLEPDFRRLAGVLLVGPTPDYIAENFVRKAGIPVVLVDNIIDLPGVVSVTSDNLSGAARAVRHLYECGHRRIGMISVKPGKMRINERFAGFYAEMHRLELLDNIAFVEEAGWEDDTFRGGVECARRLAERGLNGATALLALNDNMALGAIQEFREHGIEVPRDLSVIGIGAEPIPDCYRPVRLTSMRIDRRELGRMGVKALLARLRTPDAVGEIVMQPMTLLPGETVRQR